MRTKRFAFFFYGLQSTPIRGQKETADLQAVIGLRGGNNAVGADTDRGRVEHIVNLDERTGRWITQRKGIGQTGSIFQRLCCQDVGQRGARIVEIAASDDRIGALPCPVAQEGGLSVAVKCMRRNIVQ